MSMVVSKKIGALCSSTATCDPRSAPEESFRYIDISSIDKDKKEVVSTTEMLGAEAPSRARKKVSSGDILVSTVRPNLNAVAVVPPELDGEVASTGFCILRPRKDVLEQRYLFYWTQTQDFIVGLMNKTTGAHYPAVSDEVVKNSEIPHCPHSEQRRIVEILDQADALRKKRAEADTKAQHILPALFHQMFGDPVTNPKGWSIAGMGELLARKPNYGTMIPGKPTYCEWLDIRVANIANGRLDLTDKKYVDLPDSDVERHEVKNDDLLLARAIGSVEHLGKCFVAHPGSEQWTFDSHIMRVRFNPEKALPEFVKALLESPSGRGLFMQNTRHSAVQFNINSEEFCSLRFPLPPTNLQKTFREYSRQTEETYSQQEVQRRNLDRLFQTMLHRAFTGDLTAKWHDAHIKELLREMEVQAKALTGNGGIK